MDTIGHESFYQLTASNPRAVQLGYPRGDIERVFRAETVPKSGVECPYIEGRDACDILWAGIFPIVNEKVLDLLNQRGLTGWSTYKVTFFGKDGISATGYRGLSITGRCASVRSGEGFSEVVFLSGPSGIPMKHYRGLLISGWLGDDLFTAADGASALVLGTSKVKTVFEFARVSNVKFVRTEDFTVLSATQ